MSSALEMSRQIVALAVGLSADEVSEGSDMFSLPGWDSIAHMKIILGVEEHLGNALDPQVIVNLTSVRDLVPLLQKKP